MHNVVDIFLKFHDNVCIDAISPRICTIRLQELTHVYKDKTYILRDSLQKFITLHKAKVSIFLRLVQNACRN